jgi:cyclohexa-1,5-dienecarbonyl-CoA hydratase
LAGEVMAADETTCIETELAEDGGLLHIRLAGGKGNILDMAMMGAIERALDGHRDDPALKLILISSTPKYFSFGASIEEHTKDRVSSMLPSFHRFIRAVASYPVPVAALVEGRCLGGAFELVLACRFVFATKKAIFGCPEIKLGVYAPVLAALGPHRLGAPTAERLLLTGADFSAAEAQRLGWLTELVDEGKAPQEAALNWYRTQLGPLSALSLRQANLAAQEGGGLAAALATPIDQVEKRYLDELVPSHDGNEGISAFLEQRKPKWTNS